MHFRRFVRGFCGVLRCSVEVVRARKPYKIRARKLFLFFGKIIVDNGSGFAMVCVSPVTTMKDVPYYLARALRLARLPRSKNVIRKMVKNHRAMGNARVRELAAMKSH